MRKLANATAAAALVLSIVGCQDDGAAGSADVVGLVVPTLGQNFGSETAAGFKAGVAGVTGITAEVYGPPTMDPAAEAQMFDALTKRRPAGISVFTLAPELFTAGLNEAHKDGIPLLAIDNWVGAASPVKLFVGNDNVELGRLLAREVTKGLPADTRGDVIIGLPAPGATVLAQRAEGMRAELSERMPNVRVVGPFDTKTDPKANLGAWTGLVRANPDAVAFLGGGDADGVNLGVLRAEHKARWLAGAFDLDPAALVAVARGDLVLVSPEHATKGWIAGRLQAEYAKNGTSAPKGWFYVPGLAVTRANLAEVTARSASDAAREAWLAPRGEAMLRDASNVRPLSLLG